VQQFTPSLATDVYHPLVQKDGEILAEMRKQLAPLKGHMNGPAARASFDEVMEQTPDAPGVGYEAEVVGGIPGLWAGQRVPDLKLRFCTFMVAPMCSAHRTPIVISRVRSQRVVARLRSSPATGWLRNIPSQLP
jgi:hypothetical protein